MLCTVIVLRIGKTRVQAQSRVGRDNPISREKSDLLGSVTSATANSNSAGKVFLQDSYSP